MNKGSGTSIYTNALTNRDAAAKGLGWRSFDEYVEFALPNKDLLYLEVPIIVRRITPRFEGEKIQKEEFFMHRAPGSVKIKDGMTPQEFRRNMLLFLQLQKNKNK